MLVALISRRSRDDRYLVPQNQNYVDSHGVLVQNDQ